MDSAIMCCNCRKVLVDDTPMVSFKMPDENLRTVNVPACSHECAVAYTSKIAENLRKRADAIEYQDFVDTTVNKYLGR